MPNVNKTYVLIVLLEYIEFFIPSDNMKQPFGRGCPALYHSILLYYILSMAIVAITKCILLEFAPIMPAFCSLLLPSYIFLKIMPAKSAHP